MQVLRADSAPNAAERRARLLELCGRIDALRLALPVADQVKAPGRRAGIVRAVETVGSVSRRNEGVFSHSQAKA